MIFIHNIDELNAVKSLIPDEVLNSIKDDIRIITEEYPIKEKKFIELFGPVVVLLDRSERQALRKRMPVLKKLPSEYRETVFQAKTIKIVKSLYIITESGIVLYERYQNWEATT